MATLVPAEVSCLRPWVDASVLGPAEVHAAAVIAPHLAADDRGDDRGDAESVLLGFALAMGAPQRGHACIDINTIADIVAAHQAVAAALGDTVSDAIAADELPWPDPAQWLDALHASQAVRVANAVDSEPHLDERPAVLHGSRLYTQRQWVDECVVATALRRRAEAAPLREASTTLADALDRLLASDGDGGPQRVAADVAARSALSVIVGGPGSGKTHTIACLLAAELAGDPSLRVGIAAPTGKAASRITEAIVETAGRIDAVEGLPEDIGDRLRGIAAATVHRLLGPRPDHRTRFRHDRDLPLPVDLLVVDEASMLALPLTARLLEAVADDTRLVLVGDPDQLHSIEVGAVLGDVVTSAAAPGAPLTGHVARLTGQHRTGAGSPIRLLADAIRRGDAGEVIDVLRAGNDDRLRFVELAGGEGPGRASDSVREVVAPRFGAAREAAAAGRRDAAFTEAGRARILCGHRRGPFGVDTWNEQVRSWLGGGTPDRDPGRALLATRNDPRTGIANGDPGVLVRFNGAMRAVFQAGGELRHFALAELDAVETAFAITVHKSQGSEYEVVALVQPPADSPLATRELLYTAVTRAAQQLLVVASVDSIRRAVESPAHRVTGLTDALR
ncbi:MAG: exodeoxyribonuclease V subunit alpha [Acidimicrobiales bacterium]